MQGLRIAAATSVICGIPWFCLPAHCANGASADFTAPFPIANRLSRTIQKVSGLTKLAEFIAGTLAARAIHHQVGGNVKANISSYSATDLFSGKVKRFAVRMADSSYRGVPLGKLTLTTDKPFYYRLFKRRGLQNPLLVHVNGTLSEQALSRALKDSKVACFTSLKIDLPGLGRQELSFFEPTVEFEKDKIRLKSTVVTPGADPGTGIQVDISGSPYLDGSRIMLRDLDASSPDIVDQKQFSVFTQTLLNPLVDLARLDRKDHAFRLSSFEVFQDEISFSGNLLLAPKLHYNAEESYHET